ncbi:MAG: right-handed parallel beta-helix repeat-containing protein, partial [Planctomycetota bacterium]
DGDLILVDDGVYEETLLDFFGVAVHLQSINGPDECIIDCGGNGYAFDFCSGETEESILDGFTIRNGDSTSFDDDYTNYGGAISCHAGAYPTITNCVITNNTAGRRGGGIGCWGDSNPTILNCTITNNSARIAGGGVFCWDSGPIVIGCTITDNTTTAYGGGFYNGADPYNSSGSSPILTRCNISNNSATVDIYSGMGGSGGGIYLYSSIMPEINNCLISENDAYGAGGGIVCWNLTILTISCSTIANNTSGSAEIGGGGIYCYSSSPTLDNTILWGNTAASGGNQIFCHDIMSAITFNYCDYADGLDNIYGLGGFEPTVYADNCINEDPLFQNFRLGSGSPCIDAGNNDLVPDDITEDLDGNPRIRNSVVDIGAFER